MNFIKLFLRIFTGILSLCSEETLLHKGVIVSLFWKLNLAMIMYTDNTTVNKHPKNFQQWWLLFVTLFCMLWCRGCCSVPCFLTFITLGWKEMERTRHGERESKLWEWDPVWLRLFSFSFPLFLKVPPSPLLFFLASCTYCSSFVCVCMYTSLKSCTPIHSLSLEHTHTHTHNGQICLHGCTMRLCRNVTTL